MSTLRNLSEHSFITKGSAAFTAGSEHVSGEYYGYVEEDVNNQHHYHRHHDNGCSASSAMTYASNDSSVDGVDVYRADQVCRTTPCRFVRGRMFKRTVLAVVLLNTVILGVRTYYAPDTAVDHNDITDDADPGNDVYASEATGNDALMYKRLTMAVYACMVLFTVELALKLAHYQQQVLQMGWTLLDVAVMLAAWTLGPSLSVLRLTRLKGIFKQLPYAQVLIRSLVRVLPQIGGILLILTGVFYAFAVILTSFCPIYFTSLGQTFWFLLNIFFLREWNNLSMDVSDAYPHVWILLLIFVILTSGMLASLVIAVMTNTVAQTHRECLDQSLDSDGVSIEKRRDAFANIVTPSIGATSTLLDPAFLQHSQQLESKLDDLMRTLQLLTTAQIGLPPTMTSQELDSARRRPPTPLAK